MLFECPADLDDTFGDALRVVVFIEMAQHFCHHFIPVSITYFLMDALIAEYGQLAVFDGHIYQGGITLFRLIHFQFEEQFSGAVDRVHEAAFAFDVHTYFTGCLLFGMADGLDDEMVLVVGEEFLFSFENVEHVILGFPLIAQMKAQISQILCHIAIEDMEEYTHRINY